mmetsp:Transcript_11744/g.21795  ORF Transcript_11744/g.21795 Transcript_11744/m.21795 type:complete len:514 (-) Transcript_11744:97-1638(-)|eukprot:CAMPEP_0184529392 /NCGR_PEP_ID=MMETSP0198_2-20121128/12348_1 /TAXON_ID=1112570 /ORGANISM="Thraustochytrium sp., Strain LLF1b" /LENGTH=513 /DNA_ID=CAMNT_0026921397 /DNA_START=747 /DNA_END=2288 /DNA_ORIENTATION=-
MADDDEDTLAPTLAPTSLCDALIGERLVEFNDPLRKGHGFMFFFSTIVLASSLVWWFVRRRHYALMMRSFPLAALTSFGVFLSTLVNDYVNWNGINTFPCDVHAWTSFWVMPICCGTLLARLTMFYNKHRYAQYILYQNLGRPGLSGLQKGESIKYVQASLRQGFLSFIKWTFSFRQKKSLVYRRGDYSSPVEDLNALEVKSRSSGGGISLHALRYMSVGNGVPVLVTLFFLLLALLLSISQYFPVETSPYGFKGCSGCTQGASDRLFITIIVGILVVCGSYLLYQLRSVPDPLRIKFELQLSMTSGLMFLCVLLLPNMIFPGLEDNKNYDVLLMGNIVLLIGASLQTLYPIYLTYKFDKESKSTVMSEALENLTLIDWLNNQEGERLFATYLATEFSIENLVFYQQCNLFKELRDSLSVEDCHEFATEIIQNFIDQSSIMMVNISSASRGDVLRAHSQLDPEEKPPADLFDVQQREIYQLMNTDSFPRFCESEFAAEKDRVFMGTISALQGP